MPPHHKHHHKPHHHRHIPASRALRFVDHARVTRLLESLVPKEDVHFLQRCILDEGPIHHRGANYVLLGLMSRVLEQLPGKDAHPEGRRVPMRLPPHLEDEVDEDSFPLELPTGALMELVGDGDALESAIDCLTDGPPQHALANVVMVALLERLLRRLEAK